MQISGTAGVYKDLPLPIRRRFRRVQCSCDLMINILLTLLGLVS